MGGGREEIVSEDGRNRTVRNGRKREVVLAARKKNKSKLITRKAT
jgi:hypothetical protein